MLILTRGKVALALDRLGMMRLGGGTLLSELVPSWSPLEPGALTEEMVETEETVLVFISLLVFISIPPYSTSTRRLRV